MPDLFGSTDFTGCGKSSTATLGCAIFAIDRLPDARKVRKPHSQEWLCYENRSLADFFRRLLSLFHGINA
jgi:hypothetical protein